MDKELDVFISGETIDLCIPTTDKWLVDIWYKWFNDSEVTTFLNQGLFPNTFEDQKDFIENTKRTKDRIVLMIRPKGERDPIGVVSMSKIDHIQKQCDTALVIGEKVDGKDSLFYGFEAKALVTEHAFEKLGLERVNSSQVADLIFWQRLQILFGFQVEGILRKKFRKGLKVHNTIVSSCLLEDYVKVKGSRKSYWPGKKEMFNLMKKVPKKTAIDNLDGWLKDEHEKLWNEVFERNE